MPARRDRDLPARFAARLLAWYERHGRKELPWQRPRAPYRLWVSEIMLQQTRVDTVVPYFERFVARFPDVATLAAAPLDEVLHLWSGLGYYARARNLHAAARAVVTSHGGELPAHRGALEALPGVGRSTAGAILALGFDRREAILDGNVKRVLARHRAIEGWPGAPEVQTVLWRIAEALTPTRRAGDYAQAIMDLGATVCVRAAPACDRCPVAADCRARLEKRIAELPAPRPRRALPVRSTRFLILRDTSGALLLERRPPAGVWGGLWGFPECPPDADPVAWSAERYGFTARAVRPQMPLRHTFTHFHLDIEPVVVDGAASGRRVMEGAQTLWYKEGRTAAIGLPAPVAMLLQRHLKPARGCR